MPLQRLKRLSLLRRQRAKFQYELKAEISWR
jgi:hypothetical protein